MAAYILTQAVVIVEQVRVQVEARPDDELMGGLLGKLEGRLPWLPSALSGLTHVKEWSLDLEASFVLVKGRLGVTFDRGENAKGRPRDD